MLRAAVLCWNKTFLCYCTTVATSQKGFIPTRRVHLPTDRSSVPYKLTSSPLKQHCVLPCEDNTFYHSAKVATMASAAVALHWTFKLQYKILLLLPLVSPCARVKVVSHFC
eukprot:GHUV01007318.1.p1 GENE.GHUV01007318.1~~GHUV01007318.1.p1  ORF type:complete len:111 (+),score=7.10 GHUV01007318.1:595-927(+)